MMRVLIVDDHPIFRDGLAGLLTTLPDVVVVGTAATADDALRQLRDTPAEVVLMDINLPGTSGVEATRQITRVAPTTAVLVITMVDDDSTVDAALAAGARGYVLKDATPDDITAAVRTVASGGAVFGANVAQRLLAGGLRDGRTRSPTKQMLTPREQEVLQFLADGATNRQIARELDLSVKTVQNHVSHILDKMQAADRAQAILRARGL